MDDCIFCKIIKGDVACNKIFEDDDFLVILDAFPANKGHSLVLPKKHYKNIFEIDDEILKKAFSLAKKVATKIKTNFKAEDVNILQNNGELAGQTVFHFHIHVIPRYKNDTVVIKSSLVEIPKNELEDIKNKLSF